MGATLTWTMAEHAHALALGVLASASGAALLSWFATAKATWNAKIGVGGKGQGARQEQEA